MHIYDISTKCDVFNRDVMRDFDICAISVPNKKMTVVVILMKVTKG